MIPLGYSKSTIAILILMMYLSFFLGVDIGVRAHANQTYYESRYELNTDLYEAEQNITSIENDLARTIAKPAYTGMERAMLSGFEFGYDWPFFAWPLTLTPMLVGLYVAGSRLLSWF